MGVYALRPSDRRSYKALICCIVHSIVYPSTCSWWALGKREVRLSLLHIRSKLHYCYSDIWILFMHRLRCGCDTFQYQIFIIHMSLAFMVDPAIKASLRDSSQAPGLTFGLQESLNVQIAFYCLCHRDNFINYPWSTRCGEDRVTNSSKYLTLYIVAWIIKPLSVQNSRPRLGIGARYFELHVYKYVFGFVNKIETINRCVHLH